MGVPWLLMLGASPVDDLDVISVQGVALTAAAAQSGFWFALGRLGQEIVLLAVVLVLLVVIQFVVWRWWTLRKLVRQHPERADAIRESARRVGWAAPRPPKDPMARTHRTVIPPFGDGRPGEVIWGACPAVVGPAPDRPQGWRQDVLLSLGAGASLLVICQGKVGERCDWGILGPATVRVADAREKATDRVPVGPVDELLIAGETGWRTTFQAMTGHTITDTYFDHDGWGFVVGVVSRRNHARALEIGDHVMQTWRWIAAEESAVG